MKLKRLQLFEFEDLPWFPNFFRQLMTNYLVTLHRFLKSHELIAPMLKRCLEKSARKSVIDLCSGGGGPMRDVLRLLRQEKYLEHLEITLSDLYPNAIAAIEIKKMGYPGLNYKMESVDATNVDLALGGVRSMVCSMHHLPPLVAQKILQDAASKKQPICVFEISDNATPILLWWLAVPVGFFAALIVSAFIRPMTWMQFIFTYLIPILPLLIAWDGAVSIARIYNKEDLEELLRGVKADGYIWDVGVVKKPGHPSGMVYLVGLPT